MTIISLAVPDGGLPGDLYLLHIASSDTFPADVTADGFVELEAASGPDALWDTFLVRTCDGLEGAEFVASGVAGYCLVECVLLRGGDPTTPIVFGTHVHLAGDNVTNPTVTIPDTATTVDDSLVLVGFASWRFYQAGPPSIASGVDDLLVSHGSDAAAVWALDQAVAGTVGPWDVDRTNEDPDNDVGVTGWSLIVQPATGDPTPTIVAVSWTNGAVYDPTPPPPPYPLANPANPAQVVIIGGATKAEQDALIAAQLAAWATPAVDAGQDYYDHSHADHDTFLAFLGDETSPLRPQLVAITAWATRLSAAIGLDPPP